MWVQDLHMKTLVHLSSIYNFKREYHKAGVRATGARVHTPKKKRKKNGELTTESNQIKD